MLATSPTVTLNMVQRNSQNCAWQNFPAALVGSSIRPAFIGPASELAQSISCARVLGKSGKDAGEVRQQKVLPELESAVP